MKKILPAVLAVLLTGCGIQQELPSAPETTAATESTAPETTTETTAQTTHKTTAATTKQTTVTTAAATAETTTETTAQTIPETEPLETELPETEAPEIPEEPAPEPEYGRVSMYSGVMVRDSGTPEARALELFSGGFKNGQRFAQALNDYKAALGEAVNVWCMVIPTSAAYYTPEELAGEYGSQLDNYNNIAEHLDGVNPVPVYDAIGAHTAEPLYSRTDYHWQPLAAYYAAEQFALSAEVPYAALDTYEAVTREGYVGAFYAVNRISELQNAPESFTYYKPADLDSLTCTYYNTAFANPKEGRLFYEDNSIGASYTVFVGRDDCILQVDTGVENDRVLVIFKDSYGNALVPFLTQSFSTIYLCDFRYFDLNAQAFLRQVGATDLLFAMSTVAATTSGKIGQVEYHLVK